MNILCIGDIVGKPGRHAIAQLVPDLCTKHDIDLVIANAENAAGGAGLTPRLAQELHDSGCDVLTLGDHVWDKNELKDLLDESRSILRPANFPGGVPGRGSAVVKTRSGKKVGIINLLGRVFMRYNVDCPFRSAKELTRDIKEQTNIVVVDLHAEATSEKVALGFYLDGTVSAIFGTHTHVQTADEHVLPKGTAYITDLGMTGPHDSVIGQDKDRVIDRFINSMPLKFQVATADVQLNGVVIDIDEKTGKAWAIKRISEQLT